jgi:hypothetical protein
MTQYADSCFVATQFDGWPELLHGAVPPPAAPGAVEAADVLLARTANGVEQPLTARQAGAMPALLGTARRPVPIAMLKRWSRTGRHGVLLECTTWQAEWCTSVEAVERFARRLHDVAVGGDRGAM